MLRDEVDERTALGVVWNGGDWRPMAEQLALVAPLLTSPRQAIWLAPSAAFRRASRARRGKDALWAETSDPARARRNHLGRDVRIGRLLWGQARRLGLALLEMDGARPPEAVTDAVAAHFGPLLPAGRRRSHDPGSGAGSSTPWPTSRAPGTPAARGRPAAAG
jgi:hypothetical protein